MNEQIEKLKKKIEEIEALKREPNWGADFQLWLNLTEKLVEQIFGSEGLKLFKQQQSAILSNEGYFRELNSRKKILEGLLANKDEYSPEMAKKENHKKVGILNTGKNNTFIGNTFVGHDVGIHDEGEGTTAKENKFFSGAKKESFLSKFFWQFIVAIAVVIVAALLIQHHFLGLE